MSRPMQPSSQQPNAAQQSAARFLTSMAAAGVRLVPRARPAAAGGDGAAAVIPKPGAGSDAGSDAAGIDAEAVLTAVAAEVAGCTACPLHQTRGHTVPGEGNSRARVVFVGEGPGADEDRSGRPFVGRAGKLLEDIITKGMRLARTDVYICNVVKCRPPGNRVPQPAERAACNGFLERQLLAIRPDVICTLGATAAQHLLRDNRPMGRLRGATHGFRGIPVIATYHPAYLLRNPAAKGPTWQDIQKVMELAGGPAP